MKFRYVLPLIFAAVITFAGTSAAYAQVSSITIGSSPPSGASLSIGNSAITAGHIIINGSLTATTGTFNIGGDWANASGIVWDGGQSTVNLVDPNPVGTIKGANQFYNLSATAANGKQILFESILTQKVSNSLTLQGLAGVSDLLVLESSNPPFQAFIDLSLSASQNIEYVDVSNLVAKGQHLAPGSASLYWSVDGGNNDRWFLAASPADNADSDGLSDDKEILIYGTDPNNWDSDGDGIGDGIEVANYSDPNNSDTDYDGLDDGFETIAERNTYDSDGDGVSDFFESLGITNIFNVTKFIDTADGTCDTDCSLREAIIAANASPGPDVIVLPGDNNNTYNLTIGGSAEDFAATGDLDITDDLAIVADEANGDGAYNTIIQAGQAGDRAFHVNSIGRPKNVEINGITISNGKADSSGGGGILCENGILKIRRSIISGNFGNGNPGAGIMNEYAALILRSTVSDNTGGDEGGGIYSTGDLTLVRSKVSNNSVADNGAGIFQSSGDCYLVNCTVSGNDSDDLGGGISLESGTMTITGSTIGGDESVTTGSANSADSSGGGIAISGLVTLDITNTTISNNTAVFNGGGIYNVSGIVNITSSTIFKNNSGGSGGGIYDSNSTITLRNTILAGNTSDIGGGSASNVSGTLDSQGYNMFGDTTGATINPGPPGPAADNPYDDTVATGNPDLTDVLDPFLDPGPAGRSHFPIIDGGPAMDNCEVPPTTDQLNFYRLDGPSDIGADEFFADVSGMMQGPPTLSGETYQPGVPGYVPGIYIATYKFKAKFKNGSTPIENPFFEVAQLNYKSRGLQTKSVKLLNADGGLSGVGGTFTLTHLHSQPFDPSDVDTILDVDEEFEVEFEIALETRAKFRFWIVLRGTP